MEKHIIADCEKLDNITEVFWHKTHNELKKTYMKPKLTHNLKFGQKVLDIIKNINKKRYQFWKLVSGFNSADTNDFYEIELQRIKRKVTKNNYIYNKFYVQLITKLIEWVYKAKWYTENIEKTDKLDDKIIEN